MLKNSLIYGCIMTLAGAFMTIILFLVGLQSDPDKMVISQRIELWLGLTITVTVLVLGTRARRAAVPATEGFTYGQALGSAVMISLFAAITGTAFHYIYESFINTNFAEVFVQSQLQGLEAKGLSQDKIDQMEPRLRKFSSPELRAVFGLVVGMVFLTIISLITSIFCTRADPDQATTL